MGNTTDLILYGAIALFVIFMAYRMFAPIKGLKTLDAKSFKQAIQGQQVIDVREPSEYRSGHIGKAVNIPLSQFSARLSEIPKEQPVYLYCKSGMRSRQAANILARNGYTQITHLAGGIMSWRD